MSSPRLIPAARIVKGGSNSRRDHSPLKPLRLSGLLVLAVAMALGLALPLAPARADTHSGLKASGGAVGMVAPAAGASGQAQPEALIREALIPEALIEVRDGRPSQTWGDQRARRLPAVCAIEIDTGRDLRLFSENCLSREGLRVRLPRDCASAGRIFGQRDRLYEARCLRRAGFELPRR